MIFRQHVLDAIRAGTVTLAFRRWQRPTVKAGGALLTAVGQLEIAAISRVTAEQISAEDARRAGYASREAVIDDLNRREDGDLYRIELGPLAVDPRIALRESTAIGPKELHELTETLRRIDARAVGGPWTTRTLTLISRYPGRRAADFALELGQEVPVFKANVRKLKALGLTESLEVGYRLSPRGHVLLDTLVADRLS